MFGVVTGGWFSVRMALAAQGELNDGSDDVVYLKARISSAAFFIEQAVPRAAGLAASVTAGERASTRSTLRTSHRSDPELKHCGRVPWILRTPDGSAGQRRVRAPVSLVAHVGPRLHRCHRRPPRRPREGPAQRQAFEERFQADVLLGDLTWETSYSLPGEGSPPRNRCDITLDWPTRSRRRTAPGPRGRACSTRPTSTSRSSCESNGSSTQADPKIVLAALPLESPPIGPERLRRGGPTLESTYGDDLDDVEHAIEVSYEGSYELDEQSLADGSILDDHFSAMGGWISATLVRLGDLSMAHLPPMIDD